MYAHCGICNRMYDSKKRFEELHFKEDKVFGEWYIQLRVCTCGKLVSREYSFPTKTAMAGGVK